MFHVWACRRTINLGKIFHFYVVYMECNTNKRILRKGDIDILNVDTLKKKKHLLLIIATYFRLPTLAMTTSSNMTSKQHSTAQSHDKSVLLPRVELYHVKE